MSGTILHLFIAPQRGKPVVAVDAVEAVAGKGLVGDRYFTDAARPSDDYQLTLIEAENIDLFTTTHGKPMGYGEPRRNLVTRDIALNALEHTTFRVGGCLLHAIELCEPCSAFMRTTHPETLKFFIHRGGLRCRVVQGGMIRVGDSIRPLAASDGGPS